LQCQKRRGRSIRPASIAHGMSVPTYQGALSASLSCSRSRSTE
jgi:hypothetical protein